jgi:hypothetical protein
MDRLGDETGRLKLLSGSRSQSSLSYSSISYHDSSVGIATGSDWTVRVRFPGGARFSLLHRVQTDSGFHRASYPMGTGALSPESKAA